MKLSMNDWLLSWKSWALTFDLDLWFLIKVNTSTVSTEYVNYFQDLVSNEEAISELAHSPLFENNERNENNSNSPNYISRLTLDL